MTFPTDPAAKRVAHERMKSAAPELMAEITALIKDIPGSRLLYFKAPGVQYGQRPREENAHEITKKWADEVLRRDAPPAVQVLESQRKEKQRIERAKRQRGK